MAGGINKVGKTEPRGIQDDSQAADSRYYSVISEIRKKRIRRMNRSDRINEFLEVVFPSFWSTRYFIRKKMFCKNQSNTKKVYE